MSKRQEGALTRRGFLIATGVAALGAGLRGGASAQPPPAPIAGKEKLIVRSGRPVNLEARLADLKDFYTPEELFYVRNNYDAAPIDPAQWSLKIEGEVGNPVVLRLDDLRKLPMLTQDVTLECAGNGPTRRGRACAWRTCWRWRRRRRRRSTSPSTARTRRRRPRPQTSSGAFRCGRPSSATR